MNGHRIVCQSPESRALKHLMMGCSARYREPLFKHFFNGLSFDPGGGH